MKILSAHYARELVKQSNLDFVFSRIKEVAEVGDHKIFVNYLSEVNIERLKELGYKVTFLEECDFCQFKIDWSEELL